MNKFQINTSNNHDRYLNSFVTTSVACIHMDQIKVNEHNVFRKMSSEMHYNKYSNHADECRMFRVGKKFEQQSIDGFL